jgi:5-methylcytosine-specific restriction endonuclease McrA
MNHTPINPTSKKQLKELAKRSKLKREYIQEYGEVCMTCKNAKSDWRGLTLSHVVPLSRGGRTCRANCLLECFVCHGERHGLTER